MEPGSIWRLGADTDVGAGGSPIYRRLPWLYGWLARCEAHAKRGAWAYARPAAGQRLLDLGCGTGLDLDRLARQMGSGARLLGVDRAAPMLRWARRRLGQVPLVCAEAQALPLAAGSIDVVLCAFVLETLPIDGRGQALRELARVLRPQGRLVAVTMARERPRGLVARIYAWLHRIWPRIIDCAPIDLADELDQWGWCVHSRHKGRAWGLPIETSVAWPGCRGSASPRGLTLMAFRGMVATCDLMHRRQQSDDLNYPR